MRTASGSTDRDVRSDLDGGASRRRPGGVVTGQSPLRSIRLVLPNLSAQPSGWAFTFLVQPDSIWRFDKRDLGSVWPAVGARRAFAPEATAQMGLTVPRQFESLRIGIS